FSPPRLRPRSPAGNKSAMATTTVQQSDDQNVDALSRLEERIQRAVALVIQLRQEKDSALKELSETQDAWEESQKENAKLSEELQSMRSERQQVRGRLEKLLDHIDTLGTA
ncbi:MAG TPA: cell division protein ZapB, partial [Bryobacteraceae bacterium]|nr:cell division protein ZapB [Bryobacteraceae bacterium]